ncbi:MAG: hypothetical protein DYG89_17725 [Caldilinea sp. CFX5]|nr:hypothetical protein [Caldilinea sp. CFX5]
MKTTWALLTKSGVRLLGLVVTCAVVLLSTGGALADTDAINVSGYEAFPGLPCQRDQVDEWCNVRFYGWFGGAGAVPDGWVDYTGKGRVTVRVDYIGDPGFGSRVTITGGTWRLIDRGALTSGTISGGVVIWPLSTEDIGCGNGIATVAADLADGDFRRFIGCLHDFNADGEVALPPKIWGTFQ